jgi:hypothetical protein
VVLTTFMTAYYGYVIPSPLEYVESALVPRTLT